MTHLQPNTASQEAPPSATLLAAEAVTKSFGSGFALGPLSLTLAGGETVGILGKNGAGKSTLFQILTGNLDPTSGTVTILGERLSPDRPDQKRRLGYLPQGSSLPQWVTGHELLSYAAQLHDLDRIPERVAQAEAYWDCGSFRAKPLGSLSYGMQKRMGLALATLHKPQILILDEPHSGLDLVHVKALDEAIAHRSHAGLATVISTHVSSFAASMCTRILIIAEGQIKAIPDWSRLDFLERMAAIEHAFFGSA